MPLDANKLAQLAGEEDLFQRVFSQLSPRECLAALRWGGLIQQAVAVPDYLTADGTLTYLHWNNGRGKFFQTQPDYRYAGGVLTENRTAADARQILRRLFDGSPAAFLKAVVPEERANALLQWPAASQKPTAARTNVIFWVDEKFREAQGAFPDLNARRNLSSAEGAFTEPDNQTFNVRKLVYALKDRPPGMRVLKMGDFRPLWKIWHGDRYCFFDQEFHSEKREGLSAETWWREVQAKNSIWRRFWSQLREHGETLLGKGRGTEICDQLMLDTENYRQFWKFKPEWIARGSGNASGETLNDIFKDPDWPYWRSVIAAAEPLSQDVWNTWDSWHVEVDERVFLFDACMRKYLADRLDGLARIAREYFPKLQTAEYCTALLTPGTHPSISAESQSIQPYGNGGRAGTASSIGCYGSFDSSRWYWPTHSAQRFRGAENERPFIALLESLAVFGNLVAGSESPRNVFLSHNKLAGYGPSLGFDGNWQELVLHAALLAGDTRNLPGGGIFFYQPDDEATPEAQHHFVQLIAERDAVVRFSDGIAQSPAPLDDYKRGFVTSALVAGGRRVVRVSPNPVLKSEARQTAEGVEFVNERQTLKIARGKLHPASQSRLAPLGWWVEQGA